MELSDADTGKRRLGNPKLRENGHYAFICSGRSRSNIQSPELLGIGFDGVVASCGAHIDFHKETAYQVLLTEKQVTYALNVLKNIICRSC